jgi:hypothetical protein
LTAKNSPVTIARLFNWSGRVRSHLKIVSMLMGLMLLAACGGGGGGGETQALPGKQATFTVGGSVSGLGSAGVVLELANLDNNQSETVTVTGDNVAGPRSFTFGLGFATGARYAVSIRTPPIGLGCGIQNGSATMGSAAVTNVTVSCTPNNYNVGGTVTGLAGSGVLTLRNNGGDDRTISANGIFNFITPLVAGTGYAVTVHAQPSNPSQTCVVSNGTGTSTGGNVTNVTINCTTNLYSVGGNVSGLEGSGLVLHINGGGNLPRSSNGMYSFSNIPSGTGYVVTVATQPTAPNQTCVVANGSSTVTNGNVTNVAVSCTNNQYTISGTVSGLAAGSSLVVLNNGGSNQTVTSANPSFSFPTQISGTSYNVSVFSQPSNPEQVCTPTNNVGQVNAHVTTITVTCVTVPTMSVAVATPAVDATGVPRTVNPTIDFSVGVNGSTVTNGNVTLASNLGTQPIATTTLNARITVLPNTRLMPRTLYTLTVGTSVRGVNNDRLASPFTRRFTTADGQWRERTIVDTGSTGSIAPQIAVNANGVAIATWTQSTNGQSSVWVNRYNPNTGAWGTPTLIEHDNSHAAGSPQVAVDANGNAVVAWTFLNTTDFVMRLMANRYSVAAGTWNAVPVQIEPELNGMPVQHTLIASGTDRIIAAWTYSVSSFAGSFSALRTATHSFSTDSWSAAGPLAPGGGLAYSDGGVSLVSNTIGNTMAVWSRTTGQMSSQYSSASGTWSTPIPMPMPTNSAVFHPPSVAIDANGNAIAVWSQMDSGESSIYASRYSAAAGQWNTATLLEMTTGTALTPRVAMDSTGNAIATWQQQFGSSRYDIVASRYSVGSASWDPAALIETANAGSAEGVQIAVDNLGNALAAWSYFDGTQTSIVANRYSIQSNIWGTAEFLETDNAGAAGGVSVVVDSAGNGLAVWGQNDGARNTVYSNRFE